MRKNKKNWQDDVFSKLKKDWIKINGKTFSKGFTKSSLEQSILIYEINKEFVSNLHPRKNSMQSHSIEFNQHVINLAHLISSLLLDIKENFSKKNHYDKLVKEFFESENSNSIITFNYDNFLDEALLSKNSDKKKLYSSEILLNENAKNPKTRKHEFPILLKLHGSVNWRCKSGDFKKMIDKNKDDSKDDSLDIKVWYDNSQCPEPGDKAPCIIPPIESKPITDTILFKQIWTYAYEYLHECKELCIFGYSLPQTDKLALKLFESFENKKLKKITIIDTNLETKLRWVKILSRSTINPKVEFSFYNDLSEFIKAKT